METNKVDDKKVQDIINGIEDVKTRYFYAGFWLGLFAGALVVLGIQWAW